MKQYRLSNSYLSVEISDFGAEVKSVKDANGFEFMWQADPSIWGRTSPVLFPIVGKLKNDLLVIEGNQFSIKQHGFARDSFFEMKLQSEDSISFELHSNDQLKSNFPFDFKLVISYMLEYQKLTCNWKVYNTGNETMYFSIGAHPGFNLIESLDHYRIIFYDDNELNQIGLVDGLLDMDNIVHYKLEKGSLDLHKTIFNQDALVFEGLSSKEVRLQHKNSKHEIIMQWPNAPFLGIWAAKKSDSFVCIEPWYGIADTVKGHTDISQKKGINLLNPNEVFDKTISTTFLYPK
jgi:galactose mutarotase-like enzyme